MPKKNKKAGNGNRGPVVPLQKKMIPMAAPVRVKPSRPVVRVENGKTIVSGHEEFATLNGSVAFAATRYQVNPGLANLFAWLSGRASGYEKYRVRKLELVYVPAEAVVTTPGVVYLAMDYDPDDAPPGSLAALSSYEGLESGHTYEAFRVGLDKKRLQQDLLKIRCGPKAGSRILYDPVSFIVATVSMGSSAAIGQLWVGYELELLVPQTEPATPVPSALSFYNLSATQALVTTVAEPVEWDEVVADGLEPTNTAGVFTMPCGIFLVQGLCTFANTAAEATTMNVALWKNGAALAIPASFTSVLTLAAGAQIAVPFIGYMSFDTGDTMQVQVTCTGAAGTLTLVADRSKLCIQAL